MGEKEDWWKGRDPEGDAGKSVTGAAVNASRTRWLDRLANRPIPLGEYCPGQEQTPRSVRYARRVRTAHGRKQSLLVRCRQVPDQPQKPLRGGVDALDQTLGLLLDGQGRGLCQPPPQDAFGRSDVRPCTALSSPKQNRDLRHQRVARVFRELGWANADHPSFGEMSKQHWSSVLDVDEVCERDVKFTHTVETDGTPVCVHFKRPKKAHAKPVGYSALVRLGPNDVGVGIDPGRSNILYCVWHDGCDHRSMVLTRRRYYMESGISRAKRKVVAWQSREDVTTALETLSQTSSKGVDLDAFLRYLQAMKDTYECLWSVYTRRKWADQALLLYKGKKRTFAKFLDRMHAAVGKDETLEVSSGSAKFAPGGKEEVCVPTSRADKDCTYRFHTRCMDELRTTVVRHEALAIMEGVTRLDTKRKVGGLQWCCSTN
eukprot:scaffold1060_cov385-Pavlova_lutheri.AAC.24